MDRRRFLKYAGATAAVVGGSALGLDYYLRQSPTIGNTVTLTSTTRGLTSTESLSSIRSPSSTTTSAEGFSAYMEEIEKVYPELADELRKIPGFGLAETGVDAKAAATILELADYKPALETMLKDGIQGKRKYSGALEALAWLARDLGSDDLAQILVVNGPEVLIQRAWRESSTSSNYSSDKWNDFDEVVDRLSSPSLVAIYMADNTSYGGTAKSPENGYWWRTPEEVFKDKCGYCYDQAAFALDCLVKNGYPNCRILFVRWAPLDTKDTHGKSHAVCVYEVEGDYYTIDNWSHRKNAGSSNAPCDERLNGPLHSLDELKMSVSHGNTVMGYRFFYHNSIPFHTRFRDIWNSLVLS